jgi:23S rRNA (pseudouridine1915-N3)-methyltransferase
MRLRLICVGQKTPDWVSAGYLDYARRMPPELSLELVEIALAHRGKNPDIPRLMQRESDAILGATQPKDRVVAL